MSSPWASERQFLLPTGSKLKKALLLLTPSIVLIYIDYLMVGLRYGFYPRVTDVIS